MAVVVRAVGEIDMNTAPLLDEELAIAIDSVIPPIPVVADLRDVQFFGSNGIATLLSAQRRCEQQRIALRVLGSMPVRRPIDVLGMNGVFALFPTLDSALHG
jgi:anti-anti-sigma factor